MDSISLHTRGTDPGQLRLRLRGATAEVHAALDDRFAALGWGSAFTYHAFVRMNEACHRALEPWLTPLLRPAEQALRRQYAEVLARDMDAMALERLPVPPVPFGAGDVADAAGVVYVLDGSRLGARVIARLMEREPPAPGLSTEYVRAAAARGPVFAALDRLALRLDEDAVEGASDAACRTFDLFATTCEHATRR